MRNRAENQIANKPLQRVELVLLRHGATKENEQHRYLGQTDASLSVNGRKQLKSKMQKEGYPEIDILFTGPMKRCLETADIIYPQRKQHLVAAWTEMDFGAFEGKNYLELAGDERYQAWIDSGGTLPFPEGESREQFVKRSIHGFRQMLAMLQSPDVQKEISFVMSDTTARRPDSPVLTAGLILHGGIIMALMSTYCGGDYYDYQAANGNGFRCCMEMDAEIRFTKVRPV